MCVDSPAVSGRRWRGAGPSWSRRGTARCGTRRGGQGRDSRTRWGRPGTRQLSCWPSPGSVAIATPLCKEGRMETFIIKYFQDGNFFCYWWQDENFVFDSEMANVTYWWWDGKRYLLLMVRWQTLLVIDGEIANVTDSEIANLLVIDGKMANLLVIDGEMANLFVIDGKLTCYWWWDSKLICYWWRDGKTLFAINDEMGCEEVKRAEVWINLQTISLVPSI